MTENGKDKEQKPRCVKCGRRPRRLTKTGRGLMCVRCVRQERAWLRRKDEGR